MIKVSIPVEAGNKALKDGSLPKTFMAFVEQMKPEAAYFLPQNGNRTAIFVSDLTDPSSIPPVVEPFFQNLNASIEITPVMNLEDMKDGVERARKASYLSEKNLEPKEVGDVTPVPRVKGFGQEGNIPGTEFPK